MQTIRTHYAINLSLACDEMGDGICDGSVPEEEAGRYENAVSDECSCYCHDDKAVLPPTVEGVTAWHQAWHASDYATMDAMEAQVLAGTS